MGHSEAIDITLLMTDVLDRLNIPYVIGGSMASIIHGMLRTTMDVDIVADLQPEHVRPLVATLQDAFYADEQMIQQAVQRRSSFNLIHLETMFKIDIFLTKSRAFDQQQLTRRVAAPVSDDAAKQIWVLSAEDSVLAKLDWFRMGGETSERQWRDILGVLKTQQGRLDITYLRQWAQELDLIDLMERALSEMNA
jgi:hypothetical protein